jgi:DNA helicase-2/ATP-dependent DNA helicase PcrA
MHTPSQTSSAESSQISPQISRLLHNLNPEQLAAVTLPNQSALILAGAGSGKTRVLTTRIAWLVQTGQISPGGVLAVTFTNKAAKEMLARLSAMLPINTRGMWVGTFHGLCNRFLRAHYRDAALPQTFQILDSADQLSAIKRLLKMANIDDEKFPPKKIAHFINAAKEEGLRAKDVVTNDDYTRRCAQIYQEYQDLCQREGVVDFAELLLRTYEVLKANQPLREHYQNRFQHILVDEFQDTNKLQYAWLKMLKGEHSCVFAVGDDDQSIYAFRGADVGNMLAFEREFKVGNVIKLEQNYRSHGNILDCANHLIEHNQKRLGKNLRTDAGHGEPVRVFEANSDFAEAAWLIEEIKTLINEGSARQELAVLYRSNAQSRVIEHALFNAGITYKVYGGLRFFERAEVKHALAYLRLMENPHDDTAFLRVVNFPARGIGARSIEQLQDAARAFSNITSLYSAVNNLAEKTSGKGVANLCNFVKLIEQVRFETQGLPLPETVAHVIAVSGLEAHYQSEKEGQERLDNLNELVSAAKGFVLEEGFGLNAQASSLDAATDDDGVIIERISPLAGFLAHASLEAGDNQAQAGQDAVQLMTVHAAKGLEFNAVFITGLEEGLFPHENSAMEAAGLEEERRLMYVAITRAKQRLYISFAQTRMLHGQTRYNLKSRFFDELPEAPLKWLTPKNAGMQPKWGSMVNPHSAWDDTAEPEWQKNTRPRTFSAAHEYTPQRVAADTWSEPASISNRTAARLEGAAATHGWRVGQGVKHAKFGEGVIVNLEGSGQDARAQISFGHAGIKWLALGVAKLEKV